MSGVMQPTHVMLRVRLHDGRDLRGVLIGSGGYTKTIERARMIVDFATEHEPGRVLMLELYEPGESFALGSGRHERFRGADVADLRLDAGAPAVQFALPLGCA